ncbi:MAG: hypothetical protein GEV08_18085 [Acidimicrobiia bacterium]|nr:hypothetical protein [Acidimicrobiia bacterium]
MTTLVLAAWFVRGELALSTELVGLEDGAVVSDVTAQATAVRVTASPADRVQGATLLLDGQPVGGQASRQGDELVWPVPPGLPEGPHRLTVVVPRWGPLGEASKTVSFTVDRQPPVVEVTAAPAPVAIDTPVVVAGRTEPGAVVRFGDLQASVAPDGRFELALPHPPAGLAGLVVTDAAGNAAAAPVRVPVAYPPSAGVHVTGAAWSYGPLRHGVLDLVDEGRVNVVELDLKDESGVVNYDTAVGLAHEIGAVERYFDLHEAVAELHDRGVRVVGRIVAYRDPVLAHAAWSRGWRDWVVQGPTGEPLEADGGFTNPAHPEVRRYNLDLALEAADAGVDDILWDYIRRPEGALDQMVFPGLTGTVEAAVVELLVEGHGPLRQRGVFQGASVFGVAASRPADVAQDVVLMGHHLDYVAPMVYPSHWRAGEYGVEDPDGQPYEIVAASVADFVRVLAGSGVAIVPWLQDFSLGNDYGADQVRAQIEAAASVGVGSFLLWDPSVTYTSEGIDPR